MPLSDTLSNPGIFETGSPLKGSAINFKHRVTERKTPTRYNNLVSPQKTPSEIRSSYNFNTDTK